MAPWIYPTQHPKWLTAERPYTLQWVAPSAKLSLSIGNLDLHLIVGSLSPLEFTTQTACRTVQAFCTAHGSVSSVVRHARACPFPHKLPLRMGQCGPHLIPGSLSPPQHTTQTACRSVQPFFQGSRPSVPTLYNGPPLSPKLLLPMSGSGRHVIYGSLSPPESTTQTAYRSVQSVLQGSRL